MELDEVSYIGIKTFSIKSIGGIGSTHKFCKKNLPEKLDLVGISPCLPKSFPEEKIYENIGLGDALERAVNELFKSDEEIAVIVEWTVLTLHK